MEPHHNWIRPILIIVGRHMVRVTPLFPTALQSKPVVRKVRGPLGFPTPGARAGVNLFLCYLGEGSSVVCEGGDEEEGGGEDVHV